MAKMDESIGVAQNAEQSIRMMSFTVPLVQMIIITTAMMERYKMTMAKENMKHFRCAVDQKNCTKSISIFNDAKKAISIMEEIPLIQQRRLHHEKN